MTRLLRRWRVRLLAVAVTAAGLLVSMASLVQAWSLAGLAAGVGIAASGWLVTVVARRQHRLTERIVTGQAAHSASLRDELAEVEERLSERGRTLAGDVQAVHEVTSQLLGTFASTHTEQSERAAALADLRSLELRLTRLHSSLLTDAQAMYQLLRRYEPAEPLPVTAGWAMSPSGLWWLTRHIERARPSVILECGSGTSTLWAAMALKAVGHGHLTAVEHQPEFAARTRETLESHGLSDWADVVDAALVPTATPRGEFRWYDLGGLELPPIELLVVDGPPGSTGPHARYPALPVIEPSLSDSAVVVVDDMHRIDERETVEYWITEHPGLESRGNVVQDITALDFRRL